MVVKRNKKLLHNKRESYRFNLVEHINGKGRIISIGNKKLDLAKRFSFSILDLSVGGMKIETSLKFPINIFLFNFSFVFEKVEFILLGRICWHKTTDYSELYGIEFLGVSELVKIRLLRLLNDYELNKMNFNNYSL